MAVLFIAVFTCSKSTTFGLTVDITVYLRRFRAVKSHRLLLQIDQEVHPKLQVLPGLHDAAARVTGILIVELGPNM
jgi:hypothetical protein